MSKTMTLSWSVIAKHEGDRKAKTIVSTGGIYDETPKLYIKDEKGGGLQRLKRLKRLKYQVLQVLDFTNLMTL